VDYVYDLAGKIKQVTDPTGSYGFAYDNMGRLIGTTTQYAFLPGITYSNAYGYDAASNRTSFTAPDSSTNAYAYDTLNRLSTITDSGAGSFTMGYDALSRRTQLTRPNGIVTSYGYDAVSNLQSILHKLGVNTLDGATYAYDLAGKPTSKTNQLNSTVSNYGYDNIYQLTGVTQGTSTTEAYTFDPVGNRLSSLSIPSYAYNSSNEVTAVGSASSYTYDNNGNTLTKADSTETTIYTWDFENRLTSVHPPGETTVTFKYDPFGRRIEKGGSVYLYDGANLIEEADASGNLTARYVFGSGIDEPLAVNRGATWEFYQADGLGSITSLSTTTGTVSDSFVYDSFGNVTSSTGTFAQPFRYTGREWDAETGLYYYRARYFDPSAGRFLSEDPIRFQGGANFYRYTQNSPLNWIDPSGDDDECYDVPLNGGMTKNRASIQRAARLVSMFQEACIVQGRSRQVRR
jgi:RHS repeat-associated protein